MSKTKTSIQVVLERKGGDGSPALYLVQHQSTTGWTTIGMLERYRNTPTEIHPWKSWTGTGRNAHYNGAFYENNSVPDDGDTKYGGKRAAIRAITG